MEFRHRDYMRLHSVELQCVLVQRHIPFIYPHSTSQGMVHYIQVYTLLIMTLMTMKTTTPHLHPLTITATTIVIIHNN